MAQIPKGRLVKGPYKPLCRDCAMYFSTAVTESLKKKAFTNGHYLPTTVHQGRTDVCFMEWAIYVWHWGILASTLLIQWLALGPATFGPICPRSMLCYTFDLRSLHVYRHHDWFSISGDSPVYVWSNISLGKIIVVEVRFGYTRYTVKNSI